MKLFIAILFLPLALLAQLPPAAASVQNDPAGACSRSSGLQYNVRTGQYWGCQGNALGNWTSGVWTKVSPANTVTTGTANPTGAACDPKSIALRTPGGALYTCANGVYAAAGGSVTPGGATTNVQFNNAGALGGSPDLTFLLSTSQLFQGGPVPTLVSGTTHGEIPLALSYYKLNAVNASDFTAAVLLPTSDGFAGAQIQAGFIAKAGDLSPRDGTAAVAGTPYLLSTVYTEWNDTTGTDPKLFDTQFTLMPTSNAWGGSYMIASGDGTLGLGKVMVSFPGASLQIDSATILLGADDSVKVPSQKSATGVRYVCIDTTGKLVSQAAACVGT